MAECNINELLAANPCMAAMPPFILTAIVTQEWCITGSNFTPSNSWDNPDLPGSPPWTNPDAGGGVIVNPDT